jgi:hypothetical protein
MRRVTEEIDWFVLQHPPGRRYSTASSNCLPQPAGLDHLPGHRGSGVGAIEVIANQPAHRRCRSGNDETDADKRQYGGEQETQSTFRKAWRDDASERNSR